tara:strand:- start:71 stop:295 length:225 start_codon:yes stop_codon:yes gene_type:complete
MPAKQCTLIASLQPTQGSSNTETQIALKIIINNGKLHYIFLLSNIFSKYISPIATIAPNSDSMLKINIIPKVND